MSSKNLTDALEEMGYVFHTIIPELDKYSVDNQRGMYPSLISIAIPFYGWIAFLSYDAKCGSSNLYKARLHSPVDKICSIGRNLKAKEIHCAEGVIFLTCHSGPIKAIEFTEASIYMLAKEQKKSNHTVTWRKVNSMCLCNGNLFVSHAQGISAINLETLECRLVVEYDDHLCVLTRFGTDVLFMNQAKASIWQLSGNGEELSLFAGSEKEDGSSDGPVKESPFKQAVGICIEFDSVVYVCDAQTNSIKNCSKLKECARFLKAIGCLYQAFSIHYKGAQYPVKSMEEAISLVRQCKEMLEENTKDIRGASSIQTALNGPHGHVSARTMASVVMIDAVLQRLDANL